MGGPGLRKSEVGKLARASIPTVAEQSGSPMGTRQTCILDSHSYLDLASPFLLCFLISAFCSFIDLAISRSLVALPWILSGSVFLIKQLGGRLR